MKRSGSMTIAAVAAMTFEFAANTAAQPKMTTYPLLINWMSMSPMYQPIFDNAFNLYQGGSDITYDSSAAFIAQTKNKLIYAQFNSYGMPDSVLPYANAINGYSGAQRIKYQATTVPPDTSPNFFKNDYFLGRDTNIGHLDLTSYPLQQTLDHWRVNKDTTGTFTNYSILWGNQFSEEWYGLPPMLRMAISLRIDSLANASQYAEFADSPVVEIALNVLDNDTEANGSHIHDTTILYPISWNDFTSAGSDTLFISPIYHFNPIDSSVIIGYDTIKSTGKIDTIYRSWAFGGIEWMGVDTSPGLMLTVFSKRYIGLSIQNVILEDPTATQFMTYHDIDQYNNAALYNAWWDSSHICDSLIGLDTLFLNANSGGKMLYYYMLDEPLPSQFAAQNETEIALNHRGITEEGDWHPDYFVAQAQPSVLWSDIYGNSNWNGQYQDHYANGFQGYLPSGYTDSTYALDTNHSIPPTNSIFDITDVDTNICKFAGNNEWDNYYYTNIIYFNRSLFSNSLTNEYWMGFYFRSIFTDSAGIPHINPPVPEGLSYDCNLNLALGARGLAFFTGTTCYGLGYTGFTGNFWRT